MAQSYRSAVKAPADRGWPQARGLHSAFTWMMIPYKETHK